MSVCLDRFHHFAWTEVWSWWSLPDYRIRSIGINVQNIESIKKFVHVSNVVSFDEGTVYLFFCMEKHMKSDRHADLKASSLHWHLHLSSLLCTLAWHNLERRTVSPYTPGIGSSVDSKKGQIHRYAPTSWRLLDTTLGNWSIFRRTEDDGMQVWWMHYVPFRGLVSPLVVQTFLSTTEVPKRIRIGWSTTNQTLSSDQHQIFVDFKKAYHITDKICIYILCWSLE